MNNVERYLKALDKYRKIEWTEENEYQQSTWLMYLDQLWYECSEEEIKQIEEIQKAR